MSFTTAILNSYIYIRRYKNIESCGCARAAKKGWCLTATIMMHFVWFSLFSRSLWILLVLLPPPLFCLLQCISNLYLIIVSRENLFFLYSVFVFAESAPWVPCVRLILLCSCCFFLLLFELEIARQYFVLSIIIIIV